MNKNKNPMEGGGGPRRQKSVHGITPLGSSHQGGGEGGGKELPMISLVLKFQSPEV